MSVSGVLAGRGPVAVASPADRARRAGAGLLAGLGALGLAAVVLGAFVIVTVAANRPNSLLVPPSRYSYFPVWMAGPLSGMWPALTRDSNTLGLIFSITLGGMFVGYLAAIAGADKLPIQLVAGAIAGAGGLLLLSPPLPLTDIFNYIEYGRMLGAHGLNPYGTPPFMQATSDPAFALSNWHHLLSPYGPLFTMLTIAMVPLGVAASYWTFKVLLLASYLAMVALVWRCALMRGIEPRRALAFVGLNPVILIWGLGGDHNDFLMVLAVVVATYLLLRSQHSAPRMPPPVGARWSDPRGLRRWWPWSRSTQGPAPPGPAVTLAATAPATHAHEPLPAWMLRAAQAPRTAGEAASVEASIPAAVGATLATATPPLPAPAMPATVQASAPARAIPSSGVLATGAEAPGIGERLRALSARLGGAELAAGAAIATATAIKASAALVLPLMLLGARRRLPVLAGALAMAAVLALASIAVFGAHLPALETQNTLVIFLAIPNLVGLALGLGGETHAVHMVFNGLLFGSVLLCALWAWRRRDVVAPSGMVMLVLLVSLSWLLPWYLLWLLPFAALTHSRALRVVVLVMTAYLILAWMPTESRLAGDVHFNPNHTALGQYNQHWSDYYDRNG